MKPRIAIEEMNGSIRVLGVDGAGNECVLFCKPGVRELRLSVGVIDDKVYVSEIVFAATDVRSKDAACRMWKREENA